MKKTLCVLFALLMTVSVVSPAFAESVAEMKLQFNSNGEFRIMMFADPQDDENLEETTTQLMCEALDKYKPDLVIFLGDNTVAKGYEKQRLAIEAITKPSRDRNIPYAIVFGNHDEEQGVSKEDLLEIYRELDCLTYDADPEMTGCGTCNLPIYSSDGQSLAFNLWLVDSGDYNDDSSVGGYDYIHEDTLAWYKKTAAELKAQNGGKVVPAMDFQHIVIPEIYDKLHIKLSNSLGDLTYHYFGNEYFRLPVFTRLNGYWLEECCPPKVYDGQLDAWKEVGDVIGEFHGHDHNNSYRVNIKGVDVTNVPSCGCNSYSKEISRGAGLITLYEKDITNYRYEHIHMFDLALEKGSKIGEVDGGGTRAHYMLYKVLDMLVRIIFKVCSIFNDYPDKIG